MNNTYDVPSTNQFAFYIFFQKHCRMPNEMKLHLSRHNIYIEENTKTNASELIKRETAGRKNPGRFSKCIIP